MKRFTCTQKWDKPWFRRLPPAIKLLFLYIIDRCDNAGVWDIDLETASHYIGANIGTDELKALDTHLLPLGKGKVWVRDFVKFQYGQLNAKVPPHKPVIARLNALSLPLSYPSGSPQEKEKEKDKDKEGGVEGEKFWSLAVNWLRQARENGADFTDQEMRVAFTSLGANGFKWGVNTISDLPMALETRINQNRDKGIKNHHRKPIENQI